MSSWPSRVLDARTQVFPILTEAQISRLRPGSKLHEVEPGDVKRMASAVEEGVQLLCILFTAP